jgi:hypothetical protein
MKMYAWPVGAPEIPTNKSVRGDCGELQIENVSSLLPPTPLRCITFFSGDNIFARQQPASDASRRDDFLISLILYKREQFNRVAVLMISPRFLFPLTDLPREIQDISHPSRHMSTNILNQDILRTQNSCVFGLCPSSGIL